MNGYSVKRSKREMIEDLPEEHVRADKIGHSTTPDGRRIIRFHHTNVVTFHPNGDVTLDSGGHRTVTTRRRFQEHAPVGVFQQNWEWYVHARQEVLPFFDGFTTDAYGHPTAWTYAQEVVQGLLTFEQLRSHLEELYPRSPALRHDVSPHAEIQAEVWAQLAHAGGLTIEQLDSLPPEIQVMIDQVLEEIA